MKDPNPGSSKREPLTIAVKYAIRHFFDGFFRNSTLTDEDLNDQLFNEAIEQARLRKEIDALRRENREMKAYSEALLKTLKNKIDLSDPQIQNEIQQCTGELLAKENAVVIEVNVPHEPRFKAFLKRPRQGRL
jgi:hypothetical protein